MKAVVFYGPEDIRTKEVERPQIQDYEILVNVKACGICGSDLHMYKLGLFVEGLCRQLDEGAIPGHEFSGQVVEVGKNVADFEPGDRVMAVTFGGMAEYVTVPVIPGFNVHKLADNVSFEEAATLEPLANSLHAVLKGRPAAGDNVFIFGAGIIGLGAVQCLKALDLKIGQIIIADVSDKRLVLARSLGADETVNVSREDCLQKAIEITGAEPLGMRPDVFFPKVDIVYDCVGYIKDRPEPTVLQQAMGLVRYQTGRIVVHGVFEDAVTLDLMPMVFKQTDIIGSYGFMPEEMN
ncbi:MAG: zinc-binding dehydrogenase [Deltaproteobacteria bacterium]|nr:zinc-binding dehydrogenase [Deltaproteobacteria bacterium]